MSPVALLANLHLDQGRFPAAISTPHFRSRRRTADTEEEAVRFAIQLVRGADRDNLKIVRIKNTLELGIIEVSDALLGQVKANDKLTLLENIE